MEKNYDHSASEDQIYAGWETSGRMRADAHSDKPAYTIVLPPPNVTGQLHLGHAAMLAIEDILIRYKKMRGYESLWVPGTDHAAIATESVVIKHLGIKSREALSREDFLTECRKFATEKHDTIVNQTKKMGAWLDWSREAYTFDEARNYSVNKIFKDLYADGLIERGYRLINWSHGAQSVLSDDELEWEDREESFYYIQVGEFIMGTVRPETKCADSPLFVNPEGIYVRVKYTKDSDKPSKSSLKSETYIVAKNLYDDEKRWPLVFGEQEKEGSFELVEEIQGKDLVGSSFEYETYAGKRQFWVMADADVIDMNKGTGSMTISAAHSADDYDLAKRHGLDDMFFSKIDFDGRMTDIAGPCAGMTIEEARKESVKIMKKKSLIIGEEKNYIHRVPICYRSGCVVEPMISAQWFIAVEKEFESNKLQRIICTRHGESEANKQDIVGGQTDHPLTEKGKKQAKETSEALKNANIKKIIASDLSRARETAEIIGKALGLDIEVELWEELREVDYGNLNGQKQIPGEPNVKRAIEQNTGESIDEIYARADKALEKLKKINLPEGDILIASHKTFLSALFAVSENIPKNKFLDYRKNWNLENAGTKEMMMTVQIDQNFIFARHGESEDNAKKVMQRPDSPLTEKGKDHAMKIIEELKGRKIGKIISSPVIRAKETAEIIAEAFKADIEVLPDLAAFDYGDVTGTPLEKVHPLSPVEFASENNTGETIQNYFKRNKKAFEKILNMNADGEILVIGHRGGFCAFDADNLEDFLKIRREKNDSSNHGIWREMEIQTPKTETTTLKKQMQEAVRDGHVKIIPDRFNKTYFHWIDNLRDWCISRQIWWGHRIPVWYDEDEKIHLGREQKVYFVRHGESEWNAKKIMQGASLEKNPLTNKGQEQAKETAQKLKGLNLEKIVASDLERAQETAKIIKDELGLDLEIELWEDLREVSFGPEVEGNSIENALGQSHFDYLKTVEHLQNEEWKKAETFKEIQQRAEKVFEKLKTLDAEKVLVVTHGFFLGSLFKIYQSGNLDHCEKFFDRWNPKNGEHFDMKFFIAPSVGAQNIKPLRQDEDTLDTWFSSALWPFSTVGWPDENHPDFQKFYPNDVLETGHDILFFWVARMIMFGRYATGKYPYHTTYLHGLVCDEHGKKMSKSKGNGIDPLDVISEFGADPVRCALVIGSTPGNPIPIGKAKISGYRNFVNKIWNAGRFVKMQLDNAEIEFNDTLEPRAKNVSDQWIAARFSRVSKKVAEHLDKYEISQAGDTIYHFVWDEFCDWYLEAQKADPNPEFLAWIYFEILKLTHPLCPFVTDKIYQEFWGEAESIMDHQWPKFDFENEEAEEFFGLLQTIVTEIRKVRADKGLNPKEKVEVKISVPHGVDSQLISALQANGQVIKILSNASEVEIDQKLTKPENSVTVFAGALEIFVSVPFDEEAEKKRLEKEIAECDKKITGLEGRLANKAYTEKAPTHLVEQTQNELGAAKEEKRKLEGELNNL